MADDASRLFTRVVNEGFTSDASEVRSDVDPRALRNAFDLLNDTHTLITHVANEAIFRGNGKVVLSDADGYATRLIIRTRGNFQGAVLMLQRGMITEARIMTRAILENAFCAAALTFEPDEMLQIWEGDFRKSVSRMVDWIKKHADEDGLDASALAEAEAVQQFLQGGKLLPLKLISELGPLRDHYPTYSVLSDQAAHPTARALDWHVSRDKGRAVYRFAPGTREEIYDAVRGLFVATMPVIVGVTEVVKLSSCDRAIELLMDLADKALPSRRRPA